jgi:Glycosyl hydrolase family 79 C-terminal beta domain
LARSGAAALAAWCPARSSGRQPEVSGHVVTVNVDVRQRLATIPSNFLGLGYEISSVAIPDLLNARNRTYVELVRTLSPQGVIRVGGNTSDDASYRPDQQAVPDPKDTVVNHASLQQLGSFLNATNWQLIWGLNLGSTDERQAAAEAEAVAGAARNHLLAFEIGNEPDLFGRGTAHRPKSYNYQDFLAEFRRYKGAIRAKLPQAPFAGPDVASATNWVAQFAKDEGRDLKLLTHHYYRECASSTSTLDKLLHRDPKLALELAALRVASSTSKVPYRICETNSFCGGGKPGISDSFGAALWVLDFMFELACAGCAGVNIETGLNQLGFVSSYSPIRQDEAGAYVAAPPYYGMLAFARASQGALVAVDCEAAGANITAYAVIGGDRRLSVTIINKEASLNASVSLSIPRDLGEGRVLRLTAPSLQAKDNVTFGASAVSRDGTWKPQATESLHSSIGRGTIQVPAGSAVLLNWVA